MSTTDVNGQNTRATNDLLLFGQQGMGTGAGGGFGNFDIMGFFKAIMSMLSGGRFDLSSLQAASGDLHRSTQSHPAASSLPREGSHVHAPAQDETSVNAFGVQRALVDLGFDIGDSGTNANGVDGDLTTEASRTGISTWQRANEYDATGEITERQYGELREQQAVAVQSFSGGDFGLTDINPQQPAGDARLTVHMTGTDESWANKTMATGVMTLTTPDGTVHEFEMRSGGFGRYNDDSMLPGLNRDLTGGGDAINASYGLDYGSFTVNDPNLPSSMKVDGDGSWLRLSSDRSQTARGGVSGVDPDGFFGIHTDGATGSRGSVGDGSEGCVVMSDADTDRFMAVLQSIPEDQRPQMLEVLSSEQVRQTYVMENENADTAPALTS